MHVVEILFGDDLTAMHDQKTIRIGFCQHLFYGFGRAIQGAEFDARYVLMGAGQVPDGSRAAIHINSGQ